MKLKFRLLFLLAQLLKMPEVYNTLSTIVVDLDRLADTSTLEPLFLVV